MNCYFGTLYFTKLWQYGWNYWRPSLSICLARLCFYSKTGFLPSYCQLSTDLDKILHTPIVVRNTLVGRLRLGSARGRLQAKPKWFMFFVILVTHPMSYIETTDCRDLGGKPSEWRWGWVLSWTIPQFCSMGRARPKNSKEPLLRGREQKHWSNGKILWFFN